MPTYTYTCSKCGHQQKHILPMSEREMPINQPCPECGGVGTVKQDVCAPFLGDPVRQNITKAPSEFTRDVLKPAMSVNEHSAAGKKLKEKYKYVQKK